MIHRIRHYFNKLALIFTSAFVKFFLPRFSCIPRSLWKKFVYSLSVAAMLFLFNNSTTNNAAKNYNHPYSLDTLTESSEEDTLIISDSLNYEGIADSLIAEVEDGSVFVDSSKNVIGNAAALRRFYSKISNTSGSYSSVSVYHIGDSHIAGKSYPNSISKHLGDIFENVSTVIITPRISVRRRHVSNSMIRNAKRSKNYKGKRTKSSTKKSNSKKTKSQASLYAPLSRQLLYAENLFSNSLNNRFFLPDIQSDALNYNADVRAYKRMDKSEMNCKYTAYGVSGKSFQYFVDSPNTIKHLNEFDPDLVIISLGVNDIFGNRFEEERILNSLTKLVNLVRSSKPGADILLGISGDAFVKKGKTNPFLPKLKSLMITYAVQNNCAYWDPVPVFGGYGYMAKWYKKKLCGVDKIHCTPAGYTLMGDMLVLAIDKELSNYMQGK